MSRFSLKHIQQSYTSYKTWRMQHRLGRRFEAGLRFSARRLAAALILADCPTIMLQSRQAFKKPFIFKSKKHFLQPVPHLDDNASTAPTNTTSSEATNPAVVTTPTVPTDSITQTTQQTPRIVNLATPGRARLFGLLPSAQAPTHADLINAESRLGSTIFGPIPAGHRREFFHDRQGVWIWYEDWRAADASERELTVRYEVRKSGVYKKISAGNYFKLEGWELENFRRAAHAYLKLIKTHLYQPAQTASI